MGVTLLLSNPTTSTSTSHFRSSSSALTTPPSICPSPTTFSTVSWNSNDNNKICFSVRAQNQRKLGFGCSSPPSRRFAKIRCGVTVIDQAQFTETVLKSELPVLVEFVAEWCGPCRLISPAIEWASQEYKARLKIVKIDHDSNPQLIEEYKVYGLPALIIFKNGQEIPKSRREGAMTKVKLKEYLETFLDSVAVA